VIPKENRGFKGRVVLEKGMPRFFLTARCGVAR